MKKKLLLCSFLALLSGGTVFADTEQIVTVDGSTVGKLVTELTFSGDNVTLIYDDASSQTADISNVSISFSYTTLGVNEINIDRESVKSNRIYSVGGQYVGNSAKKLQKGIYIANGKKITVK